MKKPIVKFTSVILSLSTVLMMTACGGNNSSVTKATVSAETGDTIKMITWKNDSTVEALEVLNQKFYEQTGIKVELDYVEASDYEEFLKGKIAANEADIFCYTVDSKAFSQPVVDWAPSETLTWEALIKDGTALDLSTYNFIDNWSTGAEACRYENGIYGIATGITIMNGIFYNKKMFEEHGWTEPRTWYDFMALCEDIKEAGIAPLTVGGLDEWPVQMLTNAVVDSAEEGNTENISEQFWKGERKFTDGRSIEIYNRELKVLSYMEDDFMNVSYKEAPSRFVSGEAAMLYDGSWNASEIEKADPNFEYDYFAIPGDSRRCFTGKYDLTFGVNAKSDKVNAALSWLEFFSAPENYTTYIDYNGFVPTMSWISTSNKFLVLINDRVNDAERTYECYNRVPTGIGSYGTYDLINFSVCGGPFNTPEEFAEAAQKDWDAAMKKAFAK